MFFLWGRRGGRGVVACLPCHCGTQRGGLLSLSPACLFTLAYFLPPSPQPPSRREGGNITLFRRGLPPPAPLQPGGTRHWLSLPSRYPVQGEPEVRRKNDRTAFLLAVPAAKERGDRGRWNYPSQATAAFEMVLSPGAGQTSAAGGQAPIAFSTAAGRTSAGGGFSPLRTPQRQGQPVPPGAEPPLPPHYHLFPSPSSRRTRKTTP